MDWAGQTREHVDRYVANQDYTQAVLFLSDGSHLRFEHKGRDRRWVEASHAPSKADSVCRALSGFRLNALHLQLYFDDGSDIEFE